MVGRERESHKERERGERERSFFVIYFTVFGNVNMFPMPIKPLKLKLTN
jgi:hypothetical protein